MAKSIFVGRERERDLLTTTLTSKRPELLALYGRRRVGKTHLIRQHVEPSAGTYLEVTGTKDGHQDAQAGGADARRTARAEGEHVVGGSRRPYR
ncbi:MAG: hypothetical protein AAGA56_20830 [Myxococcota bacterium]